VINASEGLLCFQIFNNDIHFWLKKTAVTLKIELQPHFQMLWWRFFIWPRFWPSDIFKSPVSKSVHSSIGLFKIHTSKIEGRMNSIKLVQMVYHFYLDNIYSLTSLPIVMRLHRRSSIKCSNWIAPLNKIPARGIKQKNL
jgi:hypothetical protein